ncbi:hypothetical protein [Microbacterium maritypicum]
MSALDVIPLPGQPGKHARRVLVDAWRDAGSPPVTSAGRLYAEQKRLYDGWRAGKPGFNPADNPDDESQRLAHVRFGALDIDPTPDRIRRLSGVGLIRPYSYEPWHWELPSIRNYGIVRSLPAAGGSTTPPEESEEDDMRSPAMLYTTANDKLGGTPDSYIITDTNGYYSVVNTSDSAHATRLGKAYGITVDAQWVTKSTARQIAADCAKMRPVN